MAGGNETTQLIDALLLLKKQGHFRLCRMPNFLYSFFILCQLGPLLLRRKMLPGLCLVGLVFQPNILLTICLLTKKANVSRKGEDGENDTICQQHRPFASETERNATKAFSVVPSVRH